MRRETISEPKRLSFLTRRSVCRRRRTGSAGFFFLSAFRPLVLFFRFPIVPAPWYFIFRKWPGLPHVENTHLYARSAYPAKVATWRPKRPTLAPEMDSPGSNKSSGMWNEAFSRNLFHLRYFIYLRKLSIVCRTFFRSDCLQITTGKFERNVQANKITSMNSNI